MAKTLILDSGAHSIKVGLNTDSKPAIYPNCIFRPKGTTRLLVSTRFKIEERQINVRTDFPNFLIILDSQILNLDFRTKSKVTEINLLYFIYILIKTAIC